MALRKRKAVDTPPNALDASRMLEAFHHAWRSALEQELITSANVLYAPEQLLQSVLAASQNVTNANSEQLGAIALRGWQHAQKRSDFAAAIPPTNAIN